jgi:hypothetical protein
LYVFTTSKSFEEPQLSHSFLSSVFSLSFSQLSTVDQLSTFDLLSSFGVSILLLLPHPPHQLLCPPDWFCVHLAYKVRSDVTGIDDVNSCVSALSVYHHANV